MATGQHRRAGPHRDLYPLRMLAMGVGIVLVAIVAIVWTLLSRDDAVAFDRTSDSSAPGETRLAADSLHEPDAQLAAAASRDREGARSDTTPSSPTDASSSAVAAAGASPPTPGDAGGVGRRQSARAPADSRGTEPSRPARSTPRSNATPTPDPAELAEAFHREGVYRLERGDVEIAVQRLARAVEGAPASAEYRSDYGWALFRAGDTPGAAAELERSIRLEPERATAHAGLAEVRLAEGDTAAALAAYLRFLQLNDDPELEEAATRRMREIRDR